MDYINIGPFVNPGLPQWFHSFQSMTTAFSGETETPGGLRN